MTDQPLVNRIPKPVDQGKHCETCMTYLWHNLKEHKRLLGAGNEPLLTVDAERYACGLPLPSFQRDLCWTLEQEVAFIESAWLGLPLGTYTQHLMDWSQGGKAMPFSGWLVDGQQRLTTLERYWSDEFKVFGLSYSELTPREVRRFMGIKFAHYEPELWCEDKIRDLYNRLAFGGTPHKPEERA